MRTQGWLAVAALCALLLGDVNRASAQDFYYQGQKVFSGGRRNSHQGVYVHAGGGFGGIGMRSELAGTRLNIRGASSLWSLGVGGSVMPRLALHGSYFGGNAWSPTLREDGVDISNSDPDDRLTLHGVAGGATAYTLRNIYFSGEVGAAFVRIANDFTGERLSMRPGLAVRARLGKEWWINREFGLGLAGQFIYFRVREDLTDSRTDLLWHGVSAGVIASATFN